MEESFNEIGISGLNIVEFARCPYIHTIYSHVMLKGFCADSYSGFYNIHVSHLSTLIVFFALVVNAAVLYPHYKGKTMKHLCPCFFSDEIDIIPRHENNARLVFMNNAFACNEMMMGASISENLTNTANVVYPPSVFTFVAPKVAPLEITVDEDVSHDDNVYALSEITQH